MFHRPHKYSSDSMQLSKHHLLLKRGFQLFKSSIQEISRCLNKAVQISSHLTVCFDHNYLMSANFDNTIKQCDEIGRKNEIMLKIKHFSVSFICQSFHDALSSL